MEISKYSGAGAFVVTPVKAGAHKRRMAMNRKDLILELLEGAIFALAIVVLSALWLAVTPDEICGSGEPDAEEIGR